VYVPLGCLAMQPADLHADDRKVSTGRLEPDPLWLVRAIAGAANIAAARVTIRMGFMRAR
jgi:hypothetical protein